MSDDIDLPRIRADFERDFGPDNVVLRLCDALEQTRAEVTGWADNATTAWGLMREAEADRDRLAGELAEARAAFASIAKQWPDGAAAKTARAFLNRKDTA